MNARKCDVSALRATIEHMNQAFWRLMNRDFWKRHVQVGIRFAEIAGCFLDGESLNYQSTYLHFHCILRVSPSMHAGVKYVSELRWAEEWQQSLPTNRQLYETAWRGSGS
ncbi:protein rep [Marinobacter adhaerens]|uniref:Protein rep n=1 Tax=Marinobacter adhaerens TaxID=1033846 RepID=A0ABX8IQ93_9GAMM|nr:protein rep [Marinobacter adhaerens]QWV14919.1 protein rep [Marinobacter adhaerens]